MSHNLLLLHAPFSIGCHVRPHRAVHQCAPPIAL
jgi:hypothetical protein